jgi:GT2 family glycosyltransferase
MAEHADSAPVVSIILPTFDRLDYLPAAIQSVVAQSFTDWELLIADDGSGPATRAYLSTVHDPPRIRVLQLAHTGKPATARNAALRAARGEFIALLDSDDVWLPQKLATQIAALRAHSARHWSYTAFTEVDASGAPLDGTRAKPCPAIEGPFLEPLLRGEPRIVQSSVVVRRELLQRVGGYDEERRVCEDYALWIELARHSEVGFIATPLVLIRRHEQHYFDEVTALRELGRMFEKLRRSGCAPHLDAVLQERRARTAANLALAHAQRHERRAALGAVLAGAPYAWPHGAWWRGALRATAHALAPPGMAGLLRMHRKQQSSRRLE